MSEFLAEKGKMDEYGYGEDRFDDRLPYSFGYQQNLQKKTNPEKKSTRDKLDRLCTDVNYDLAISKSFYFFFLAAYGSVFPLIAVYFKQLGMSATQTGLLIGFRPFVEMVAGPFWGNVAERWKKWKTILLFSIFCWVAFTLSLAFVQPPAHACLVHNGTDVFLARPFTVSGLTFSDLVDRNKVGTQRKDVGYGQMGGRSKRHLLQEESSDRYDDEASDAGDTTELGAVQFKVEVHPNFGDDSEPVDNQEPENVGYIGENRDELGTDEDGVDEEHPTSLNSEETGQFEVDGNQHRYYGAAEENGEDETPTSEDDNHGGATEEDEGEEEEATSELMLPTVSTSFATLIEEVTGLARGVTPAYRFQQLYQFRKFPFPTADRLGISPLPLDYLHVVNVDEQGTRGLVSPPLSAVVYRTQDIQSIFLVILMLQIVGEFLSAPAIPMADTATLGYLGDELGSSYGRQRMFGSIGWAVAMFFVGIALDHSNVFPNHPCGSKQLVDRNYMTCYAVFSVLMCCALLSATQFRFKEEDAPFQTIQLAEMKDLVIDKVQDKLTKRKKQDRDSLIEVDEDDEAMRLRIMAAARQDANTRMTSQQPQHPQTNMVSNTDTSAESCPYVPRGKPGQAGTLPQWMEVLKMFLPIQYSSMLFVLWFMGFGVGLMFAFLYWHLQDLKGTPTLFGIASVFNHVSEIVAYFFIQNIVLKIGHVNVIYAGLIGNVVRFIYVSYLENPWWILPFEFLQGLTHAGVWAVGCSYVTQAIPAEVRPTAQFILQSLHQTVGRGCGTIIGGAIISQYGTEAVFRGYGIVCIFVLVGYFALNFFYIRKLVPAADAAIGPTAVSSAAESSYLAPHGVPGDISGEKHSINRYEKGDGTSGVYGMYGANMDHPYPLNGFLDSAAADSRSYSYQQYGFEGASKDICNDPDYQYGHEIDVNDFKTAADLISSKHLQNIAAYKQSNVRNDSSRTSHRNNEDEFRGNEHMEFQIARRLATQPDSTPRTETVQEQPPNRDFPRVSPSRNPAYQQNYNWLY